jgi:hypothetical protein
MRETALARRACDRDPTPIRAARGLLKRHSLVPSALVACGLEAVGLELRRHVTRGDLVPAGAGVATLEQIVGQEFDVGAEALRREPRLGDLGSGHNGAG